MYLVFGEASLIWSTWPFQAIEIYDIYVVFVFFLGICIETDADFIVFVVIRYEACLPDMACGP